MQLNIILLKKYTYAYVKTFRICKINFRMKNRTTEKNSARLRQGFGVESVAATARYALMRSKNAHNFLVVSHPI